MTPAAILDRAADVLDTDGWIQGTDCQFYPVIIGRVIHHRARYCVLGAIRKAGGGTTSVEVQRAVDALGDFLGQLIVPWNDSLPRNGVGTVTAALRACAAVERARTAPALLPLPSPAMETEVVA